jgi:SNF2 family DNA or RNA helicase
VSGATLRVSIGVDRSHVVLACEPVSPGIVNRIFLAFSTGDGSVDRDGGVLTVPDVEFTARLGILRQLQRELGVALEFDSVTQAMVEAFVCERRLLRDVAEHPNKVLDEVQILSGLERRGFLRTLTREQLRDVARLGALRNGANFSVPGAGKTTALLALHALLSLEEPEIALFVVAPRNALMAWDEELEACFGPQASLVRLTGGVVTIRGLLAHTPRFSAITYQQLPIVLEDIKGFLRRGPVHLVLDESHRIKGGAAGVHGAAVLELATLARRRDILSGTPMPQAVPDLYGQFDFLWPGHRVCDPLRSVPDERDRVATANAVLRPLFMRTTKAELGLPELEERQMPVELGPGQRELYELLRSEAARVASGLDRSDLRQLRSLGSHVMRLLQAASNPSLLLNPQEEGTAADAEAEKRNFLIRAFLRAEQPAKVGILDALVRRILESDASQKIVIWTSFVRNVEWLADRYAEHGAVAIHGLTPTGDDEDMLYREARIKHFNTAPECRILVANPAACGEGISLHKACHNAIYFDRTYNAAHYLQSVDRIHRLGLPAYTETHVYTLTATDTVDDSVRNRLTTKIAALGSLLDDQHLIALALDAEDQPEEIPSGLAVADLDSLLDHILGGAVERP